jgi:hypothetical protein
MAKTSKAANEKIEKVMHEFGEGKLKSGTSGKTVTSQKQAVAIALSEAREKGLKVPPASKKTTKKGTSKK